MRSRSTTDKALWAEGESAGAIAGKSKVGQMIVRYDEARVAEMPLTPGFHVAYCSVAETADHDGLAEVALCYRVLSAAEAGSYKGDMTIRLSGYAGTTTLTNFPLLVQHDRLPHGVELCDRCFCRWQGATCGEETSKRWATNTRAATGPGAAYAALGADARDLGSPEEKDDRATRLERSVDRAL